MLAAIGASGLPPPSRQPPVPGGNNACPLSLDDSVDFFALDEAGRGQGCQTHMSSVHCRARSLRTRKFPQKQRISQEPLRIYNNRIYQIIMTDETGPRIVAAGRGATMSEPKVVETVLQMASKSTNPEVAVLYLGTATFDEDEPMERQCRGFQDAGCVVTALRVSERVSDIASREEIHQKIISADVILVSGGNTLYAVTRCERTWYRRFHS